VPEILAAEKKSIYIDADIVVLGDLGELWDTPMQGCPLLAVPFAFSHHLEDSLGTVEAGAIPGFRELGIPRDSRMMNGGLLVMDLDRWRRENYSRQIFEYLRKYHDSIRFWDQDGLNAILAGKWGGLPAKWNYCVDCGQPARQVDEGYLENLEQEASVVHFASSKKPWHYYCDHPAKEVFFGYLDKTPESGWRPFPPWRVFMNPHFWGQQVRKIPVIGPLWSIWRRGGTSSR
jgi:lipopolysaccharide biosynthesis glycosyltransferase